MPSYKAPLDEYRFILNEVLNAGELSALPGFEDATPDLIASVLEESAKFCETVLQPLNQKGDAEGCTFENGVVRTPAASRRPTIFMLRPAGRASAARRNMAARACRTR